MTGELRGFDKTNCLRLVGNQRGRRRKDGAEVFALVLGARGGVNPVEIAGFLVGLVTVDVLNDDCAAKAKATED